MRGPQPVFSKNGPVKIDGSDGLATKFAQSASIAYKASMPASAPSAASSPPVALPTEAQAARTMMNDGFALIYATCSEFFDSGGQTQKWLIFARDVVGAAGTLATSVLALTHAGSAATAGTALGTGALFSAVDIYTKDFLFSAENISSVETLTLNALAKHSSSVPVGDWLTYNDASIAILDNQKLCTVSKIASMAKDAIRNGKPNASTSDGDTTGNDNVKKSGDSGIVDGINRLLQPVSDTKKSEQVAAVYWLLYANPDSQPERSAVCNALAFVPPDRSPVEEKIAQGKTVCNVKSDWPYRQNAKALLDGLSQSAVNSLKQSIAAFRTSESTQQVQSTGLVGEAPVIKFEPPTFTSPRQTTHVNIDIR